MSLSPQWCLGAGLMAPVFIGALALGGALVARDADGASSSEARGAATRTSPSTIVPAAAPRGGSGLGTASTSPRSGGSGFSATPSVEIGRRDAAMESRLRALMAQPKLRAGAFGYDMRSRSWFTIDGDQSFAAASLIKIPVAVALLAAVDRGEVSLDEKLPIRAEDVGAGSGSLQYLPLGSSFSLARLGEMMIRKSDNTATNMVIARL